ncbi:hypothetical protein GRO01_02570 [Gluconobacter roseus NBRC 3990]|uniref:Uncharacterized protein n=2 Tax=Gluconobacter roseus TaxID=586239 RepID=A0A4Y3M5Y3_9PROT|nr:hypothetical protein AD943_04670 [Gluconobacter roseus]GEB02681.1 hypothetical protein GRO01_02570 [Gluconobacter roseus NBRC 3990]
MGVQLAVSLQDLRRLEAVCLEMLPAENRSELQGFDRIMQVLGQLAQGCEKLSLESGVKDLHVGRRIVDELTLEEMRQRLVGQTSRSCVEPGDVELF